MLVRKTNNKNDIRRKSYTIKHKWMSARVFDDLVVSGHKIAAACEPTNIQQSLFYRWKKFLKTDQQTTTEKSCLGISTLYTKAGQASSHQKNMNSWGIFLNNVSKESRWLQRWSRNLPKINACWTSWNNKECHWAESLALSPSPSFNAPHFHTHRTKKSCWDRGSLYWIHGIY